MRLKTSTRRCLRAALIALACSWSLAVLPQALAWQTGPVTFLPGIPGNIVDPKIAGSGAYFHVVFGDFPQDAGSDRLYYSRGIAAANGSVAWVAPQLLATGVATRWRWNIEADSTGTVHVIYGSSTKRLLYIKNAQQGAPGSWSLPEEVSDVPGQANEMDIALDTENTPYVAWGEGVGPSYLNFAYRRPDGVWLTRTSGSSANIYSNAAIAVSGGGASATVHVMVQYKRSKTSDFAINYATGQRDADLKQSDFSGAFRASGIVRQPTLAIDRSDGTLYTGFFSGEGSSFDFSFSYSTNNGGSWAPSIQDNLGSSLQVTEKSPIVATAGTAYVLLQVKKAQNGGFTESGFYDTRFTLATRKFTPPVAVRPVEGSDNRNGQPDYAFNSLAKAAIWVTGFTENIAYNSEAGGRPETAILSAGSVTINGGADVTRSANVTVALQNVVGQPTRMKVAIDGDPTASTPDEPFSPTFNKLLPPSSACTRSIAVQLFDNQGTQSAIVRDTIKLDVEVQTGIVVGNPYKRSNVQIDPAGDQTVDDGAGEYTRLPVFYLELNGASECSALKEFRIGRDATSLGQVFGITENFFAYPLAIPGAVAVGPNSIVVQVADTAGNTGSYTKTIIYDPNPPVLTQKGTLGITVPTTGTNILAQLDFGGNVVSDTLYLNNGRQFWGIWLANSRTPVADPLNDTSLVWSAVEAPGSSNDFSLGSWSLLSGIPAPQQQPGSYYVYARFLDGAGNATTGVLSNTITLDEIRKVKTQLPIVIKP